MSIYVYLSLSSCLTCVPPQSPTPQKKNDFSQKGNKTGINLISYKKKQTPYSSLKHLQPVKAEIRLIPVLFLFHAQNCCERDFSRRFLHYSRVIPVYLYLSLSVSNYYLYLYLFLSISLHLYLSLSISLYLCLSLSISLPLSISLKPSPSISIYVNVSLPISIYLYLSLSVSTSLSLSISISFSACLSVCLPACLGVRGADVRNEGGRRADVKM